MDTKKSRIFTDEKMAKKIAKDRGAEVYLLGRRKDGVYLYFVGEYKDALSAAQKNKTLRRHK